MGVQQKIYGIIPFAEEIVFLSKYLDNIIAIRIKIMVDSLYLVRIDFSDK